MKIIAIGALEPGITDVANFINPHMSSLDAETGWLSNPTCICHFNFQIERNVYCEIMDLREQANEIFTKVGNTSLSPSLFIITRAPAWLKMIRIHTRHTKISTCFWL
jgi:hypothetical protein